MRREIEEMPLDDRLDEADVLRSPQRRHFRVAELGREAVDGRQLARPLASRLGWPAGDRPQRDDVAPG